MACPLLYPGLHVVHPSSSTCPSPSSGLVRLPVKTYDENDHLVTVESDPVKFEGKVNLSWVILASLESKTIQQVGIAFSVRKTLPTGAFGAIIYSGMAPSGRILGRLRRQVPVEDRLRLAMLPTTVVKASSLKAHRLYRLRGSGSQVHSQLARAPAGVAIRPFEWKQDIPIEVKLRTQGNAIR
ncbi:hypothetical protein AYL99_04897 [Fonsecaea erecta]|uniref:Uncharacterized protein n=1 Tax=Fonsecaea erecta TaxID=1367422 RepID=A0A178ZLJ6_9EURO|nr:hypothetical protein AYL99_04897 [Fonsecaea erecta]OAP59895.1 hypothetical protein AYL99_04897 [Fonsecaea erecta]